MIGEWVITLWEDFLKLMIDVLEVPGIGDALTSASVGTLDSLATILSVLPG
jgi:hypothetical protein